LRDGKEGERRRKKKDEKKRVPAVNSMGGKKRRWGKEEGKMLDLVVTLNPVLLGKDKGEKGGGEENSPRAIYFL